MKIIHRTLSFTLTTYNNEHQCCQVVTEWKKLFVVTHLSGIPPFSDRWCVRIQYVYTSCLFLEPRRQDTGLIFGLRSGRTSATCASRNSLASQEQCKFSNPLDHLDVSSSCSSELIKSPEEHTLSSLDEMRPQRISEILDSTGGSQRFTVK